MKNNTYAWYINLYFYVSNGLLSILIKSVVMCIINNGHQISSTGLTFLQFLQRFNNDDDQITCIQIFPRTSCTKLLRECFQNRDEWWGAQARASANTHFHTELFTQVVTNTHSFLEFSYMSCMSRTSHSLTLTKSPPDDTRSTKAMYSVLLIHVTFLATGVQWIWRLWCFVQAWSQIACH